MSRRPRCRPSLPPALLVFLTLTLPPFARGDDSEGTGLTLADLVPYRAALEGKPAGTAVAVTFRALWDHPEQYQGRRVQVEGRIARRFLRVRAVHQWTRLKTKNGTTMKAPKSV